MTDRNDRIRELAYLLWLEEGCPEGQAERHWQAAETLLDSEGPERKRVEGEPPGDPMDDSPTVSALRNAGAASPISRRRAVRSEKEL